MELSPPRSKCEVVRCQALQTPLQSESTSRAGSSQPTSCSAPRFRTRVPRCMRRHLPHRLSKRALVAFKRAARARCNRELRAQSAAPQPLHISRGSFSQVPAGRPKTCHSASVREVLWEISRAASATLGAASLPFRLQTRAICVHRSSFFDASDLPHRLS